MRLLFVNWAYETHGSAQDLYHYARVAREMGHEVALYGPPAPRSAFASSLDVSAADAVVFVFEFTTYIDRGDGRLDYARLVAKVPRRRRVVIDCDGAYNEAITVGGDSNHSDAAAARRWVEVCDSLADKVCQPTLRPLRPNVRPFLFHGYDPGWERPLDFAGKEFGMVYVGNNWFRWGPMGRVLRAIELIRNDVGRIAIVGEGWDVLPERYRWQPAGAAQHTDPNYLRGLGVELHPPVRFDRVIDWMGRGVFGPVLLRPLFDHLGLVTCRTFETPAAGTLPLFAQDPAFVEELYGADAAELVLPPDQPAEKILDLVRWPERYAGVVRGIRERLAGRHSYRARLRELIEVIES
ncbi:MAG TPA: glycosyltransferase [Gemmataceae bacterium]|nr:glycosyltransferase [Gemmataceae bacterium]